MDHRKVRGRWAGLLIAVLLLALLAACAPVQNLPPTPAPRDWFTRLELETALIAAGVSPDEAGAGLCSAEPNAPDRLLVCVQYGPEPLHFWWEARWDSQAQRVRVEWRENVEVQI
jgi:hypothetical protein